MSRNSTTRPHSTPLSTLSRTARKALPVLWTPKKFSCLRRWHSAQRAAEYPARRYALRLNGQLLLGYTRIHSYKVKLFQEEIKKVHERLTLSFRPSSGSIDLPKSSRKGEQVILLARRHAVIVDSPQKIPPSSVASTESLPAPSRSLNLRSIGSTRLRCPRNVLTTTLTSTF